MIDKSITNIEELDEYFKKGDMEFQVKILQNDNVILTILVLPILAFSAWVSYWFIILYINYYLPIKVSLKDFVLEWKNIEVVFLNNSIQGMTFINWYMFLVLATISLCFYIPLYKQIEKNQKKLKELRSL